MSWVDCRLWNRYEGGDHSIFVGEVVDLAATNADTPLLYHNRLWRRSEALEAPTLPVRAELTEVGPGTPRSRPRCARVSWRPGPGGRHAAAGRLLRARRRGPAPSAAEEGWPLVERAGGGREGRGARGRGRPLAGRPRRLGQRGHESEGGGTLPRPGDRRARGPGAAGARRGPRRAGGRALRLRVPGRRRRPPAGGGGPRAAAPLRSPRRAGPRGLHRAGAPAASATPAPGSGADPGPIPLVCTCATRGAWGWPTSFPR